ncbi:hypothetical protein [Amycolatopsis sp.]|uniref:hypothetical protein n=1 Tax=Amycolatopsis sp. TaxID=37632 RepID=UPI002CB981EB|nr:hypothetical protein [Amycolatopsis sp.]HVV12820.1 hypothetical protein [Amycolatopsis sp.]
MTELPPDAAAPAPRAPIVLNESFFAEAEPPAPPVVLKLGTPPARLGRRRWTWRVVVAMAAVAMALFAASGAVWLTAVSMLLLVLAKLLDDLTRRR